MDHSHGLNPQYQEKKKIALLQKYFLRRTNSTSREEWRLSYFIFFLLQSWNSLCPMKLLVTSLCFLLYFVIYNPQLTERSDTHSWTLFSYPFSYLHTISRYKTLLLKYKINTSIFYPLTKIILDTFRTICITHILKQFTLYFCVYILN